MQLKRYMLGGHTRRKYLLKYSKKLLRGVSRILCSWSLFLQKCVMVFYNLAQKLVGFCTCRGEEERVLHKNNVGVRRVNHSIYIFVLAR